MSVMVSEAIWLDETGACSIEQLAQWSDLTVEEIHDLVDTGVIAPIAAGEQPPSFGLQWVATARMARRLRQDFELNQGGLAMALVLLQRIERLEEALAQRAPPGPVQE